MARDVGKTKFTLPLLHLLLDILMYGIDMPAVTEFIAMGSRLTNGEEIGADKLFYQTLEDLIEVTSINGPQAWDTSCFNGEYVTGDNSGIPNALEEARMIPQKPNRENQMLQSNCQ